VACRYRCQDNISQPFKVIPIVNELGRTRIECNVTVKSTFSSKMFALNVVVLVPVPDYTAKANILVTNGKAKYDATKKALVGGMAYTRQLLDAWHTLKLASCTAQQYSPDAPYCSLLSANLCRE
jgi:hypothetical protein